jgi:hypothetical protein
VVAVLADAAQLVDASEVDDLLGRVEAHPQDRQERLPAAEDLGLVAASASAARASSRSSSGAT